MRGEPDSHALDARRREMPVPRFIARQFAHPSGLVGRFVMGPLLNLESATLNRLVLDSLAIEPDDQVLEVGFGGAALLQEIAKRVQTGCVCGVDRSEAMVAAATARFRHRPESGRVELRQGMIEALPYPAARFTKACSVNTVYFWPSLFSGLTELARVLRPGGRLVLGFASDERMRRAGFHEHGFALYSPEQLSTALREHGFLPGALTSGRRGLVFALAAQLSVQRGDASEGAARPADREYA
jgi:SAM-dependent methyltransferase